MTQCYECAKGELVKKQVEYTKYGLLIGKYPAEVCSQCNEIFFESNVVGKIEEKVKEKSLWGLASKSRIGIFIIVY